MKGNRTMASPSVADIMRGLAEFFHRTDPAKFAKAVEADKLPGISAGDDLWNDRNETERPDRARDLYGRAQSASGNGARRMEEEFSDGFGKNIASQSGVGRADRGIGWARGQSGDAETRRPA
jgi:hypothetical protein